MSQRFLNFVDDILQSVSVDFLLIAFCDTVGQWSVTAHMTQVGWSGGQQKWKVFCETGSIAVTLPILPFVSNFLVSAVG